MKIKVGQLKSIIREVHEETLKEFNAKQPEDEFILQLVSKFPIKAGFNPADGEKWVRAALKSFGPDAMNFLTVPKVWAEKIRAHYQDLPREDVIKLARIILKAIGA